MRELTYTKEEKRRMNEDGTLNYPKFPKIRKSFYGWESIRFPYLSFYPSFLFGIYLLKCDITTLKNAIRKDSKDESALTLLDEKENTLKKWKKEFYSFLHKTFEQKYYEEDE